MTPRKKRIPKTAKTFCWQARTGRDRPAFSRFRTGWTPGEAWSRAGYVGLYVALQVPAMALVVFIFSLPFPSPLPFLTELALCLVGSAGSLLPITVVVFLRQRWDDTKRSQSASCDIILDTRTHDIILEARTLFIHRPGGPTVFELDNAAWEFSRWTVASRTYGSVLLLHQDGAAVRIGGEEHLFLQASQYSGVPVRDVHFRLSRDQFADLVQQADLVQLAEEPCEPSAPHRAGYRVAPPKAPESPLPHLEVNLKAPLQPDLGILGVAGSIIVGTAMGAAGFSNAMAVATAAAVLLSGVGAAYVQHRRPPLRLVVQAGEVKLFAGVSDRLLASAPIGRVSCTKGHCPTPGRYAVARPALKMRIGDEETILAPISRSCFWRDAPVLDRARYLVGPADWRALVNTLGLGGHLEYVEAPQR